jgi:hypothetical protein
MYGFVMVRYTRNFSVYSKIRLCISLDELSFKNSI